jgi:nitrate/TMAO reductase-like tetraheme cytochrome c subunit
MWSRIFFVMLFSIYVCAISASPASARYSTLSEEARGCLECHAKPGLVKKFNNNESVIAYVDLEKFKVSVHRSFNCSDCHTDFSSESHPKRMFRDKEQYRIKTSSTCRRCHSEQIMTKSIHEPLFKEEKAGEAVICTNCHSAHAVVKTATGHVTTSEEKYCLRCHSHDNQKIFKNGQFISLLVKVDDIRNSAHRNVACSDCHFGYSSEEHPRRRFGSKREYRLSSSEICRRCHFDKYSKVSESIHFSMINVGRLDAPTCIDCHGGHVVSSPGKDRLSVVYKCRTCHKEIYNIYSLSVHGDALINMDNKDVPTCIDCHSSHSIKDPLMSEFHNYIPDMCSKCHSNEAIMGKYGLSTEVINTYMSDFHGLTLSLYREEAQGRNWADKPMAVCTDCHGTHDIISMSGADLQVIKKNLLKRCRTCHKDATENFSEAWLSHHKPSFQFSTGVFLVEKLYKIMLPLMVVGLLFQILLQIWRYLTNR